MNNLQEARDFQHQLLERWDKTPWLQKSSYDRGSMSESQKAVLAYMLENQSGMLKEFVSSPAVAPFTTVALPMIRRIFGPDQIAQQLVSVQPLSQPVGKIFFLDLEYGTDVAPIRRGQRMDYQVDQGRTANNARYYTRGWVRGEVLEGNDGLSTAFAFRRHVGTRYESEFTPVRKNDHLNIYVDAIPQRLVFDPEPAAGEVYVDTALGNVVFGTAPASGATVTADYDLRFEGPDSRLPEFGMSMTSENVSTDVRKMMARWTIEAEQDFSSYHGIDVDPELTAAAAGEIQREIDREIIFDLLDATRENVNWDARYPGPTSGYSRPEFNETLIEALNAADHKIHTKRGVNATWLVTGSDVSARLMNMKGFQYAGDVEGGTISDGPRRTGTFNARWNVIVDPAFEPNTILLGHKGDNMTRAGYVYFPHIGLIATERMMDPVDMTYRKGWMMRDGSHLISSDFYSKVTIQTQ